MSFLLPYMQLRGADGTCVEVVNNCRLMYNLDNEPGQYDGSTWNRNRAAAEKCGCCWVHDSLFDEDGFIPNPWLDELNPATEEVAGLRVDAPADGVGFWIQSAGEQSFREDPSARLELSMTFTVASRTRRGELAFIQWLRSVLESCCNQCDGFTMEVFTHCPCEDDFDGVAADPGELLSGRPEAAELCAEDPPVLVAPENFVNDDGSIGLPVASYLDDGLRQILQVRFVGLDPLFDQALHECAGNRYILRMEVLNPEWYSSPTSSCTIGGAGAWGDDCECRNTPIILCNERPVRGDASCGPRARSRASTASRSARWKQPLCFKRNTCLTAPQPASLSQRMQVRVDNGKKDVYNARLLVWSAVEGIADPATNVGDRFYRDRKADAEYRIPHMRPNESIVIGADGEVTLICATGAESVSGSIVEGPEGRPTLPTLDCSNRYWIALDLSCDERSRGNDDLEATVEFVVVESP